MDAAQTALVNSVATLSQDIQASSDPKIQAEKRRELIRTAQRLALELKHPGQIDEQFLFSHIDTVLIKIGVDLKIFETLAASDKPVSLDSLVASTGAEKALLARTMRGLGAIHAIDEADVEVYEANKVTKALADSKGSSGINLYHGFQYPAWWRIPEYLSKTKYVNPTDPSWLPFNLAYGEGGFFPQLVSRPDILEAFQGYMVKQRWGHVSWLDFYPLEQQVIAGFDRNEPDGVVIVDVGGSVGHECLEIRRRYPELPGRLILQDLPSTIEKVPKDAPMEAMAHDIFTPQPIKGARAYYLRSILHDWDDDKCRTILKHIRDVMKPGYSKILVNELNVPLKGASAFTTHSDFMVMALTGAVERTEDHWRELFASAGLRIDSIWTEEPDSESIFEVVLA